MIIALIVAVLAIGMALIAIGLRGRRIGNAPHCRACGFNLAGLRERTAACTECGADISTPRSVRTGQHQRRVWAVLAGVVLLIVGMLPATLFYSGATVRHHLPTAVLMQELRWMQEDRAALAADELFNRHLAGKLNAADTTALANRAFEVHSSGEGRSSVWGVTLAYPTIGSALSAAQQSRALLQGVQVQLAVNGRARTNDNLPTNAMVSLTADALANSQRQITLGPARFEFLASEGGSVFEHELPTLGSLSVGLRGSQGYSPQVPCRVPPGRYRVRFTMAVTASNIWGGAPMTVNQVIEEPIQVVGPDEPLVEVVDDPLLFEQVGRQLRLSIALSPHSKDKQWLGLGVGVGGGTATPELEAAMDAGLQLVYECFARLENGTEVAAGGLVVSRRKGGWVVEPGGAVGELEDGAYALVLRPSIVTAEQRVGITKILGGPIEMTVNAKTFK